MISSGMIPGNLPPGFFPLFFLLPLHPKYIYTDVTGCKKTEMSTITTEKKSRIFAEFGGDAKNTGSIEGQIALLTERINHISQHLKKNKKDFSSNRGLMAMVGQRKRLLMYLNKHNITGYRALLERLGLRK